MTYRAVFGRQTASFDYYIVADICRLTAEMDRFVKSRGFYPFPRSVFFLLTRKFPVRHARGIDIVRETHRGGYKKVFSVNSSRVD